VASAAAVGGGGGAALIAQCRRLVNNLHQPVCYVILQHLTWSTFTALGLQWFVTGEKRANKTVFMAPLHITQLPLLLAVLLLLLPRAAA
jgi:hypothetical protein